MEQDRNRWVGLAWEEHSPDNGRWLILLGGLARAMRGKDAPLPVIAEVGEQRNRELRIAAALALEALRHRDSRRRLELMRDEAAGDALLGQVVEDALTDLEV